jgi:histidinol-phosphate aminotransferase
MLRPGMESLPSYSAGEEPNWLYKLDANERSSRLPNVAMLEIARRLRMIDINRYPDMGASRLRMMLGEAYQLPMEQVVVGNGSSELIAAVCATFGGPGRPIAYQWPSFSMYPIYAAMADSPAVAAPLGENFQFSAKATLETVQRSGAKLLILCNPNNPTGTVISPEDLRTIIRQSPCPVLVDEAYMEYYGASSIPWLAEFPNLIVARTFSKAYGLASARVGYLLASPVICAAVGKRLLPYHTNTYSLTLAEVCFAYREKIMIEVQRTIRRRDRLLLRLSKLKGVQVFPSATNFLLIKVEDPDTLHRIFIDKSIGVRNFSHTAELTGCLRVTIGNPLETGQVFACLQEYSKSRAREGTTNRG